MTGVAGLDLSLTSTGVATAAGGTFAIKTNAKRKDHRLEDIYFGLVEGLKGADLVVMEDLPYNAMQAGTTGMVQGVARLLLNRLSIPYAFLSPATLKKFATNNGKADKVEMAEALLEYYGVSLLAKKDNDQVDAAWLRIAGLHHLGVDTTLADRLPILAKGKWENWSYST